MPALSRVRLPCRGQGLPRTGRSDAVRRAARWTRELALGSEEVCYGVRHGGRDSFQEAHVSHYLGIPVIIVFEGWSASGKGTLINQLILPLDPRGFSVYSASGPTEEEKFYPFLWRFWKRTPTRGRLAIFDRSWDRRVVTDRVEGQVKGKQLSQAFEDIRSFERQLADDGVVIVKCFLHISKREQKRR